MEIDIGYNQGTLHPQTEYTVKAKVKVHNFQDSSWPARRANFRPASTATHVIQSVSR